METTGGVLAPADGAAGSFTTMALMGLLSLSLGCTELGAVTIMEIQGPGVLSPLEGRTVETSGLVTFVMSDGRGFFLQDPLGDQNPATSEGIFVTMEEAQPGLCLPSVGDAVRARARVQEARRGNALPRTQLARLSGLEIESSGNPLPVPAPLEDLPNESLREAKAFWEPLEGMRVSVQSALVVSPTSRFGEFAVLTPADAQPGSGYYRETRQILLRPLGGGRVDYNPERILVAGGRDGQTLIVRPGDRVVRLVGVVDYTFGNYKIRPSRVELEPQGPPQISVSRRSGGEGDWVVTTLNVENLFDLEDDPEKDDEDSTPSPEGLEVKLRKLAGAIHEELRLPEILVVQEVENERVLAELAARVNGLGHTAYVATSRGSSDRRGIEVGFLWDRRRVRLREAYLMSGPEVETAFGASSESRGREPLVGVFEIRGHAVTVIGNHFKSKGGDDPLYGLYDPPLRRTEVQRKAQARVVRHFVDTLLQEDPDAWIIVAGDLNDFPFGEPGEGPDHPLAILEGEGPSGRLTNLISRENEAERYTFVYQGNSQVLDHILVSPAMLAHVAGTDVLHFNACYPAIWSRDDATHLRCSDHDAVEARFRFD